jgi:hypothetical protein
MFNKEMFVVGTTAPAFYYNDKVRAGTVEKVTDKNVCLCVGTDEYKTFSYDKMNMFLNVDLND